MNKRVYLGGENMLVQVKENICHSCNHFKEGYYKYYTHDNRMVECYRSGCQKHLGAQKKLNTQCAKWEPRE